MLRMPLIDSFAYEALHFDFRSVCSWLSIDSEIAVKIPPSWLSAHIMYPSENPCLMCHYICLGYETCNEHFVLYWFQRELSSCR